MDIAQRQSLLAACSLFSLLDESDLSQLAHAGHESRVGRGEILQYRGEDVHALSVIAEGAVKLYLSARSGKEFCLSMAGRGMAVEPRVMLVGAKALAHAVATEKTVLFNIPSSAVHTLISLSQRQGALLRLLLEQTFRVLEVLEDVALHSLDVRVARVLHRLHIQSATNPAARLHRLDQMGIAEMANGTRPKVNGHLQALRRLGAIDIREGAILLKRPDLLAAASEYLEAGLSVPQGTATTG
jgi:CRP-like cAMP-binding protein